LNNQV